MSNEAKKHILVVEDSPDLQLLLEQMFKSEGYGVIRASHGQEALNLLRSAVELPVLILLDLMMPVMDGFAFRQEQQKDPRIAKIPVVVMTASSELGLRAQHMQVSEVMRKPIDMRRLLELTARLSA